MADATYIPQVVIWSSFSYSLLKSQCNSHLVEYSLYLSRVWFLTITAIYITLSHLIALLLENNIDISDISGAQNASNMILGESTATLWDRHILKSVGLWLALTCLCFGSMNKSVDRLQSCNFENISVSVVYWMGSHGKVFVPQKFSKLVFPSVSYPGNSENGHIPLFGKYLDSIKTCEMHGNKVFSIRDIRVQMQRSLSYKLLKKVIQTFEEGQSF